MRKNAFRLSLYAAVLAPALALAQVNYSPSMSRLLEAADRLREAIQEMAQHEAGPKRDKAIDAAQRALYDTQAAMTELPPELRTGVTGAQPDYTESMERLMQAAQKLREAVQAMAQQPSGPERNDAAARAREALMETQQAMVMLPTDLRTGTSAVGK